MDSLLLSAISCSKDYGRLDAIFDSEEFCEKRWDMSRISYLACDEEMLPRLLYLRGFIARNCGSGDSFAENLKEAFRNYAKAAKMGYQRAQDALDVLCSEHITTLFYAFPQFNWGQYQEKTWYNEFLVSEFQRQVFNIRCSIPKGHQLQLTFKK